MGVFEKEKDSLNIIRSVLKEKAQKVSEEIKKHSSLTEFLQACKDSPEKLDEFFNEHEVEFYKDPHAWEIIFED